MPPYLSVDDLDTLILRALTEDVGTGDVTTTATIPPETQATAQFLLKADGVLAGLNVAERVFAHVDEAVSVSWTQVDGSAASAGTIFGRVEGRAQSLLVAERLALNLLQRMSGIATETRRYVDAVAGTGAQILDTRKTAPGLRALDKWAVLLGGGINHRVGLYDRILIKDNHIDARGGIVEAIEAAAKWRDTYRPELEIECETRTLEEVRQAVATSLLDYILLDNMVRDINGLPDTTILQQAVDIVGDAAKTEASGGVTLATARPIAEAGVDFISVGALTHSVQALDISLKIKLG